MPATHPALSVESLANADLSEYILQNPKEISAILQHIAQHKTRVALYYNGAQHMFLSLVLAVDEQGIWLDGSSNLQQNKLVERSEKLIFVSTHNNAKVQFFSTETTLQVYQNTLAFYLPMPTRLLRLQRRDYYRLHTNQSHALTCVIRPVPGKPHIVHEVPVADISIGGVALSCEKDGVEFHPGMVYQKCEIKLPSLGTLTVTLEVRNTFNVTGKNGKSHRRAGCIFVKPDTHATSLLQRYVAQMQQKLVRPGL